ncbi:right-handed parallel beta-helix repeat-containing protein [Microbacterium immunditiarum]|uniref:Right handed beta helix domain-containing protein n=1 Tax=Microbacterium immunditiarum TaxID=337480 RepID=A0A7Y9KHU8_9MICO|nr:right-handed parallel beta-helix repeat-containing protein [Microbacterium immunditiarum]NYE19867.1 hypothetical protein [Microbacterium immunditiarum]
MTRLQRFTGTLLLVVVIVAAAFVAGIVFRENPFGESWAEGQTQQDGSRDLGYAGDAEAEAALVAAERERVSLVTSLAGILPWRSGHVEGAYRLPTAPLTTLVLPARQDPYTIHDLRALSPDAITELPDGAILVSESIVALPQAALDLSGVPAVKLASTPEGFASIVVIGGALRVAGAEGAPLAVNSFDPRTGAEDTTTADGRAYIRVQSGTVDIAHAAFAQLGFWSGETGGLALTGAEASDDRPALAEESTDAATDAAAPLVSPDEVTSTLDEEDARLGPVSGSVQHATFTGNAYGLFVADAAGLAVGDSTIDGSLIDGLVLHRDVTDTELAATTVSASAGDGIVVGRSSASIAMTAVTVTGNGRNGIAIDGRALAQGPNPAGSSTAGYGDIAIVESRIADNARYGVEVSGARDVSIADSDIAAGIVGVVVDDAATLVTMTGNTMSHQQRQSIALRDGASEVGIRDNVLSSVGTGVHLHDATADIRDNRFADISQHAVTLVGHASGTRIVGNVIAGHGTTAVHDDAVGGYAARNDLEGWSPPVTPRSVLETFAQPLTLIWTALGVLVVITALTRRKSPPIRHPYPEHIPLTQLTRGIVPPESIRRTQ